MEQDHTTLNDADLDLLYDPPPEHIQQGVMSELISFHIDYLARATFFCLATGRENGLDASPRGGPPGFVKVLDNKTIAFADWPGNNRIESMRNLVHDNRVGMLFLFPGLMVFMRINGHARCTSDETICRQCAEGHQVPKTVTIIDVREVFFHCGRAVSRARLWQTSSHIERSSVPSPGQMRAAMTQQGPEVAEKIDETYHQQMNQQLY
ncbi:Pyridoxamine 5'-phosphate oxidase [Vibrio aerogenes CECT 7868]|uniref:Pyridoxamine 5'-phosphate oxidase n=1 Tax=Vibrio aerogenes CECT 7868 TaxID=1216006 RepID=A0A1M5ZTE2_9VIBR|nr:MSMEG_1061 family FMN-dependent PPOX-type flavoprotein [Vibrio aerogenes]SHI27484.1 Pyridoxamine 5'-phosphate oxidase [Vibrio aerogenes CECT 7868]